MSMQVSFRAQVAQAPTVIQQAQTNESKEDLNKLKTDTQNNQLTDIAAMTQKMQIESKMQDAKAEPVKYVEDVKPQPSTDTAKVSESGSVSTPNTVTDVIKNFHRGERQYNNNQRAQVLFDQMNQYAMSNRILHGLF